MSRFAEANLPQIPGFVSYTSAASPISLECVQARVKADFSSIFEEHRHRVYSLAFWMTDNEMTAEEISSRVFLRSFHRNGEITAEVIDETLVRELRELMNIGSLTLDRTVTSNKIISGNTKRIHLERAVVQIPVTERLAFLLHDVEGYDHTKVAATLDITEEESRQAVFQARVLVRELVAEMI